MMQAVLHIILVLSGQRRQTMIQYLMLIMTSSGQRFIQQQNRMVISLQAATMIIP
jgi:hypothetical protein